jgi:hypothetical protein
MPNFERRLFWETAALLGVARFAVVAFPFRRIAPYIGKLNAVTPNRAEPQNHEIVDHVSQAVQRASRCMPWKSRCLDQALAAGKILGRRGIGTTLYLGVSEKEEGDLCAHAWLRSGNRIVTGKQENSKFSIITTFAKGNS